MITAFRLVHVMRCHKKSHAFAGELEEQIPKLATRDGIDSSRRFVEEKHSRLVHERTGHRQTLTPAS
jgi:hypothetical protein